MADSSLGAFTTLDLYLSGYLVLHGVMPELRLNNGKVIFVFPISERLYKMISSYNSNVQVPVIDFVTTLKMLRGQMLTMRPRA